MNIALLVGNLGKDAESQKVGEKFIIKFSVATSKKFKKDGELEEKTEWHRVVFFSRLAEIVGEYLRKGSQVYVEGRLQTRKWQDQSGQDRYTTEIVANEMQMLGGRGDGGGQAQQSPGFRKPAEPKAAPAQQPAVEEDFQDDDIPF